MASTGSEDWKPTACNLCYANCGILVQTEGHRIKRVKGDKDHPASRGYSANTIIRDPAWMKSNDATLLTMHPEDARTVGVGAGERVQITTEAGQAIAPVLLDERMQRGTVSLPNGLGLAYPNEQGDETITGTAPNELTSVGYRDKFAGTPFHKHVPARLTPALPPSPAISDPRSQVRDL